ncbi:hypothetical protein LZ31DRAFT_596378 [Colletotrichum somersetense]|nr:hypothetical protein LZ31DRAFT_596378 [Colletotrichum somersetense]
MRGRACRREQEIQVTSVNKSLRLEREREVLPRVNIWIADGRETTAHEKRHKPLANTMCALLKDPASYDNFDESKTNYYVKLSRNGRVIASENVGLQGEFHQAIQKMLALVGRSANVIQQAARYAITWELRDGEPMFDELPPFEEGELLLVAVDEEECHGSGVAGDSAGGTYDTLAQVVKRGDVGYRLAALKGFLIPQDVPSGEVEDLLGREDGRSRAVVPERGEVLLCGHVLNVHLFKAGTVSIGTVAAGTVEKVKATLYSPVLKDVADKMLRIGKHTDPSQSLFLTAQDFTVRVDVLTNQGTTQYVYISPSSA